MRALVVGGSGGIGRALVEKLSARQKVDKVVATWHRNQPEASSGKVRWVKLDATDEDQIADLARQQDSLDILINCVGFLHNSDAGPEKTITRAEGDFFLDSMRVNALPTLLLARYFMPPLRKSQRAVFATVSARVGSIGENHRGGWYSYRASKAALNMLIRTLSIEWQMKLPRCSVAALHPGTTDTALSEPFQRNVPEGKLFSPQRTAAQLLDVIDGLTPENSGRFWSWDGTELPW